MKFEVDMKINDDEIIKLIWEVPEVDGRLDWENAGEMQVYEREVIDDDVFNAVREVFRIMIDGYYEGGDDIGGEEAGNAPDEG